MCFTIRIMLATDYLGNQFFQQLQMKFRDDGLQGFVAIGKPERQVRKASHVNIGRASTPRSLYYCLFASHIYGCCSSRTFRSWWTAHSAQRQRRGCNRCRVRLNIQIHQLRHRVWNLSTLTPPFRPKMFYSNSWERTFLQILVFQIQI